MFNVTHSSHQQWHGPWIDMEHPMEESKDVLFVKVPSEEMMQVVGKSPVICGRKDGEDVIVGWAALDHQIFHNA